MDVIGLFLTIVVICYTFYIVLSYMLSQVDL